MSNIYIQEPPTSGKILLETTVGDIDLELWSKEAPKACRNFIQLCKEGYYDGVIFHRVVPGFIAQGGDPTGTGHGGESVYGAPFKDEFHSRLRFARRGLLAMANAGRNDNGSQFFFTLAATPELQGKHTIFGKIAGDTLYNMLKLEQGELDDERPLYPQKIIRTEVLFDPFDIIPRMKEASKTEEKPKKKNKSAAAKNFKLLSFGDEAEEDEDAATEVAKQFSGKSKSSHDLTNDPKLSSAPAVPQQPGRGQKRGGTDMDALRNKLQKPPEPEPKQDTYRLFQDDEEKQKAQLAATRSEFEQLKKDMQKKKKLSGENEKTDLAAEEPEAFENPAVKEYKQEKAQFEERKKELPKRGASSREAQTMAMLEKFKSKLQRVKEDAADVEPSADVKPAEDAPEDDDDDVQKDESWMVHELHFTSNDPVLAKDASAKAEDWYDIYDPRNEMNKRRREKDARRSNSEHKHSSRP